MCVCVCVHLTNRIRKFQKIKEANPKQHASLFNNNNLKLKSLKRHSDKINAENIILVNIVCRERKIASFANDEFFRNLIVSLRFFLSVLAMK